MSARRWWAWPLVPVYRAALAVKAALCGDPKRLKWPVVSVGSLSAGGAGKTPVVIALALLLKERGWGVDVLSRGYGRSGRGVDLVAGDDAERFGDEPVVMASRTGVPVWVGAERFAAGQAAELQTQRALRTPRNAKQVHLLDDVLLPAGNLREPLTALGRADVVVVREEEIVSEKFKAKVWGVMREGAQMWVARRRLVFPNLMKTLGAGLRPVAFCAIARPENFAAMLLETGCGVVETVAFADHHAYTRADVLRVIEVANGLNASGFVTTEKDAVKLTPELRGLLEAVGPLMVVALEVEFVDAEAVVAAIETKLLEARIA